MNTLVIDHDLDAAAQKAMRVSPASEAFSGRKQKLERAISQHPAVSLGAAVAAGVALACLLKR